jgi:HD-GYP domain-containing protein (c-di-GMP phosphodiesterase class II)
MRSFSKQVRIQFTVLISIFVLTLASLGSWLVFEGPIGTSVDTTRRAFRQANELVVALHGVSPPVPAVQAGELLDRSRALRSLLPSAVVTEDAADFFEAPVEYVNDNDSTAAIRVVGSVASSLDDRFFDQQKRRARMLTGYLITLAVLGAGFIGMGIRSRRLFTAFFERIGAIMTSVSRNIEYEENGIEHEPRSEEERELTELAKRIAAQIREDREMAGEWVYGNLEAFMPRLKQALEHSMPCERLAVAFLDQDGNVVAESAATSTNEIHLEPGFSEPCANTSLGEVAAGKRPRVINDLEEHYRERHQSEATELVLKEGIRSSITLPIIIRSRCLGFLFISSTKTNAYGPKHVARAEKLLNLLKQNLYFHYLTQQIVAGTANAFVNLMERKDNETSLHILRMSRYSHAIARTLSTRTTDVTPTMLREILWFAPLHDVGKIGVPDSILLKPGKLTARERREIEKHVPIGADVVKRMETEFGRILDMPLLSTALDIIEGHHEHYDGRGYPRGLAGGAIPIAGRITAIADVFDALTSRRPYKEAMSIEEALEIMGRDVGTHFDPIVYQAFLDSMDRIREIYDTFKEV